MFTAEVQQLTSSKVTSAARTHILELHVQFRNTTNQPIIIAYAAGSSAGIDNLGNRYYWGTAGTHDVSAKGIGIVEGRSADPQFVLKPGETRGATFTIYRKYAFNTPMGTSFAYDLSIDQLQILPSQQVQNIRQYSVHFPTLTAGTMPVGVPAVQGIGNAVNALRGLFKKKK